MAGQYLGGEAVRGDLDGPGEPGRGAAPRGFTAAVGLPPDQVSCVQQARADHQHLSGGVPVSSGNLEKSCHLF